LFKEKKKTVKESGDLTKTLNALITSNQIKNQLKRFQELNDEAKQLQFPFSLSVKYF
jgi:hypothetical protein